MADTLSSHISKLHSQLSSDTPQRGVEADNVVVDLSTFCLQNVNEAELAYCSSLLFHEESGVITFMKKSVLHDQFAEAKVQLLKFLTAYVEKLGKRVNPYAVDIKEICVKLFSQDRASKVKAETFPLLVQLLEVRLEASVVEQLNVAKLIDKYLKACMQPTKHTSTVKFWLYLLVGKFAEFFPEHTIAHSDRLVSMYVNVLKEEMVKKKSRKPDMQIISGCLRGLTAYLVNFTQSVEEGSKYAEEIFKFAGMAVDPQVDLTRYDVPKAGLHLFSKHAGQFKEYLTRDHEIIYNSLFRWCRHKNTEAKRAGFAAMNAFLMEVSDYLISSKNDENRRIFKSFVEKFRSIIDSNTSNTWEMSTAIRGYGYFAKPCKMFMQDDDVKFMFSEMIQRSEQIYFSQENVLADSVQHLPVFLEALSCIIEELEEVSDAFIASLERFVVILFDHFPRFGKGAKFLCYKALVKLLFSLSGKGAMLKGFLSQVVYQALIRSCFHPVSLEEVSGVDISVDGDETDPSTLKVSYKDYLELWEHLLDKTKFKDLKLRPGGNDRWDAMHEMMYDELIQAILRVIHKLDFTFSKETEADFVGDISDPQTSVLPEASTSGSENEEPTMTDPVAGLEPNVPKDYLVFINLVEFCKSILPRLCVNSFEKWIYVFGREIIIMSSRFPVVSGFYKLLEICMKMCTRLSYFKGIKSEREHTEEDMEMDIVDTSDCLTCFALFRKFVKEVLSKMTQYKDDLLRSCLELVLSLPHEMVAFDVNSLASALKGTFKLGLSYLPLAEAGLNALESWTVALSSEDLKPIFKEILPCLDDYLRTSPEADEESKTIVPSAGLSKRRKIPVKLLTVKKRVQELNTETALSRFRLRVLQFLGRLGGQTNSGLLGLSRSVDTAKAMAWDSEKHLSFAVPFHDMKPTIFLDPFLPQIVELATTSSDRQTKVAACELLHSLVLYMLGKSVTQPEGGKKSPMEKLWKRVFPVMLRLACDVEQVAEQLFKPLVFQLIHWFTNNKKFESPETMAILDAILDGIIHPRDAALRDLSAQCVREFLQWSIKQTTEKQLTKSQINIKSLLKRVYSLALHPSAFKRLGAALALNSILTVFREESSLVDLFVLEILITFLDSLALAHADDQALGTQEQSIKVISHLVKIVKVKANLLNKENKHRRVPRAFQNLPTISLSHLIPWLVKQCGKPQSGCRHQCMALVCQFAPLLPGTQSATQWIQNTREERQTFFIHRFEGGGGGKSGLLSYPTLPSIGGPFSLKETFMWFDFVLAALDCYTWCFGERLLSPNQVFLAPSKEAKYSSVLFQSLEFFLSRLAMYGVKSAHQCFPSVAPSDAAGVFTPKEMDDYNRVKCTVIVRIMDFVTVLLNQDDALKVIPTRFWSDDLFNIVLCCVLEPGVIGFNMGDVQVIENLPEKTGILCTTFVRKLPKDKVDKFIDCLRKKIALGSHCNLFEQLPFPLRGHEEERLDHLRLAHLVQGYQQLHAAGLLLAAMNTQDGVPAEQLSQKLLNAVYDALRSSSANSAMVTKLSPASQQLFAKLLQLAFDLGLKHDTLMECIIHESKGRPGGYQFGLAFYNTFKSDINAFLVRGADGHVSKILLKASTHPSLVSSILNGILDQLIQDKRLRKRHGRGVCSVLLDCWHSLAAWWNTNSSLDLKHLALMLLTKILSLDAKVVTDSARPSFHGVFRMYLSFLSDANAPLSFKSKAIHLLPYFTKLPANHLSQLRSHLDNFVADSFPLKSTEFIRGSPKYNDYIAALDKLLSAFVASGSVTLLNVLLTVICREAQHAHEERIQSCIVTFISRLNTSPNQAKDAMDVCFEVFMNERDHTPATRRAVIDRVCVPFLLYSSIQALKEFFVCHIREIMSIVEVKQLKASDVHFESQLVSKLCCFKLLEVLYTRLSKTDLNLPESVINKAYCANVKTGKELTMAITKCAHAAKSEDMRGETLQLELRRQHRCAAYNALVALISCTQTEVKFYVGFLFTENTVKGQFLFDNLLDCTRKYDFEVELLAPVSRKKQITSIRMEARAQTADGENLISPQGSAQGGPHYLSSQYLADSSLSEDVSLYDFSTPVQAYSSTHPRSGHAEDTVVKEKVSAESAEEEVEMDELNQHECMGKLIGLVRHLSQKGVTGEDMPSWMAALHKKFCNFSTHVNVQLFLAKLIINEPEIFEPYAKSWISPLMELLLSFKETESSCTVGFNYFMVDLVVTMLSWNSTAIPEDTASDRQLSSRLVEFLMSRSKHSTRSVFRNNLEIIRTLVEVWKDRIKVPTKVIYEAMSGTDPEKKDNATGIQLLGIVLANKLSPFSPESDISEDRFCSSLINNLTFKYKDVHSAAAEVTGMLMKHLAETRKITDIPLCDKVVNKLLPMMKSGNVETGKFITCVNRIQVHYPPIADRFINQVLYLLPTVHGDFKTQCLEVLLGRVEHIPSLFTELKNKGLKELLAHRDEGSQVVSLRIIQGLLKRLELHELQFVLDSITAFMSHPSSACRELMYDILIWIFDTYSADETFRAEEGAVAVLSTAKDFLLQGLADDNKDLKLKLRNFWSDENRLPNTTLERLVEILRAMYSPNTEAQYLSYTTNLILHLTSVSPDFDRLMFEQPLSECKFEECPINYAWHKRHLVMTPLFAATQGGTLMSGMSQVTQSLDESTGRLRATQNPQFTPTQATGRSQTYDWLNPSSQEMAILPSQSFAMRASESHSSLLFNPSKTRSQTWKPVPADFGSQRLQDEHSTQQHDSPKEEGEREILRLKRRFLKDQSSRGAFFAKQEAKRKTLREQAIERRKAAREGRVVMYRTYRAGDLPDIQIKHSELIAPLQAVAQCDNKFAKQLFSSLFRGISSQIEEKLTEREATSLTRDINLALNEMISSTTQCFPPFVSSVQDICYHEPKLLLEATSVSSCCLKSFQEPIGIMLLEKQLLSQGDEQERASKRAKVASVVPSKTTTSWLELSKLYRQLGDYDVLRGIFSGHIGAQPITRRALEAEGRGDYAEALRLYNEAMECDEWSGTEPQQEEEDLWDEARLQCFANLTQWENLEKFSTLNIDENDPPDLDKIWTNAFYQDHYLPFILCSKLKRWCQGTEDKAVVTFVTNAMQNKDRATVLEDRHSDSLALLYILKDDLDRARYYIEMSYQNFLTDWAGLDVTMIASRSSKLQSLQKITEMQEFLDFFAEEENFTSIAPVSQLLEKWSSRLPNEKLHSINVWDDIVTNRCMFMNKILRRTSSSLMGANQSDSMDIDERTGSFSHQTLKNKFLEAEIHLQLHMANTAKEQANFPVAVKYLREAFKAIPEDSETLRVMWTHTYVDVHHSKAKVLAAAEAVETALRSADQLDKYSGCKVLEVDPARLLQHHILKSRTLDIITTAVCADEGVVISSLDDNKKKSLASICGSDDLTSPQEVVRQLMTRSFSSLQLSIKAAKKGIDKRCNKASEGMVQALMAMVNFCDSALKKREDDPSNAPDVDVKLFPVIVIRYMLKAMRYDSDEARQKFPRLLQLVELYPDTLDTFAKQAVDVPSWMFIAWINQMVALLDKREGQAVHAVLLDIANTYPQALCYPFKISGDNFQFGKDDKLNEEAVKRLKKALDFPLLDDFIAALEQLTNPEMVFKDWCDGEMKPLLEAKRNDSHAIKECFNEIQKLFDHKRRRAASASQSVGSDSGEFRRKFAQEFAAEVERAFGKDGSKLKGLTSKAFAKMYNEIHTKMRNRKTRPPCNLKEYSSWLSNFQANNHPQTMEIPGQYTGRSKPLPEYHVKIAGFDERVSVMQSMRMPKRLIIRGDDEKDHMFLVKGGEDLRLDQRIVQLFVLMNDIMAEDPACSQRGLQLRTYQVIPMTPRVGLIEWMKNTQPLKHFLQEAMTDRERQDYNGVDGPKKHQCRFLAKYRKSNKDITLQMYGPMYKGASRTETERSFKQRQNLVPWNLLRRAFVRLSASPQAYLTLRSHFTSTHACLSVCQYILGIGDRHLSNFMVDMETGGMVGIDFGHAFGSATQFLSVPELMPFRLTQQFINLLLPLKHSGSLQNTMVHTLRALRTNHELLVNTMDVFIKEPSLDWQVNARKQVEMQGIKPDNQEDAEWFPKQKIMNAKRKLEGANPAHLMRGDLQLSANSRRQWAKDMEAVCMGHPDVNIRAREAEQGLSVEVQVACLIDQATDPNILGRTYEGWESWM